ncbi:unnamed protein product [Calypogeia fissa]
MCKGRQVHFVDLVQEIRAIFLQGFFAYNIFNSHPRHCSCKYFLSKFDDDEIRVVGELAQLLDLHDIYQKKAAARVGVTPDTTRAEDEQVPSMSDRFEST